MAPQENLFSGLQDYIANREKVWKIKILWLSMELAQLPNTGHRSEGWGMRTKWKKHVADDGEKLPR